jgi:hypothetical protein
VQYQVKRRGAACHATPLHLLTPVCEDNSSSALGGPRLGATESRPALAVSASRAIVHAGRARSPPPPPLGCWKTLSALALRRVLFYFCAHLPRQCAEWKADTITDVCKSLQLSILISADYMYQGANKNSAMQFDVQFDFSYKKLYYHSWRYNPNFFFHW